jgi:uncharacterized protein YggU (UPF0235/DUF167 family)
MTRRFSLLKLSNAAAPFTFRARDSSAVIRFSVRVHAGSPTSRVGGDFNGALQVRVQSQAVDGAATNEVCAVLAHVFGVRPGAVQCVRGATTTPWRISSARFCRWLRARALDLPQAWSSEA